VLGHDVTEDAAIRTLLGAPLRHAVADPRRRREPFSIPPGVRRGTI
jgi:hypothetical protein